MMKTSTKVFIIIGGVILGLALVSLISGLLISSITMRSSNGKMSLTDIIITENLEQVKSIEAKIDFGEIDIEYGTDFSIKANNVSEKILKTSVRANTLHIEYAESKPLFRFHSNPTNQSPKFTVTVPQDLQLENFVIKTGAAEIKIDDIKAANCEFTFGAGSLKTNNINFKNFDFDCGAGNAEIRGMITGNSDIKSGIGSIKLDLIGNIDDYGISVDCGIGSVIINGDKYSGIGVNKKNTIGAKNDFRIECGTGDIEINIEE